MKGIHTNIISVWCGSPQKGLFSPVQLSRIFIAAFLWSFVLHKCGYFVHCFKKRIFWRRGNYSQQLDSAALPPSYDHTWNIYWITNGHNLAIISLQFFPHMCLDKIQRLKATHFIGTKRHNCSWSKQHLHIRWF